MRPEIKIARAQRYDISSSSRHRPLSDRLKAVISDLRVSGLAELGLTPMS